MDIYELLLLCKNRNELDFLFEITKRIAETDSIGESYNYCENYTVEMFNAEMEAVNKGKYPYIEVAGFPIYLLYLKHIKVL
jgi:hypothetical protein